MARIVEYRDISLDDLTIGKGQARVQDVGKGVEDLADSIRVQGLLHPIVVCSAAGEGKWEILTGQRRFLAHKMLKRDAITAAVLDQRVGEQEAKAISITENLIRRKLSGKELKDGILYLYNIYMSIRDVVEATGLPYTAVRDYVKYPRLLPELKAMVDEQRIDINAAVKAQDAATDGLGEPDAEVAIRLAQDMATMTGVQRKRIIQDRREHPDKPIDEIIEQARTGSRSVQIVVTVGRDAHTALQQFAREEGVNQDDAAATLIEEALAGRGFLEE